MTEQHRCYPSTHWKLIMIEPTKMQCHTKWENIVNIPDCSLPKGNCLQKISCDRKDRKGCPKKHILSYFIHSFASDKPSCTLTWKILHLWILFLGKPWVCNIYLSLPHQRTNMNKHNWCSHPVEWGPSKQYTEGIVVERMLCQCVSDWRPIWHPGICLSGVYWGRLDIKMQPPNLPKSKASHSWR